jgi:hypothetical protein
MQAVGGVWIAWGSGDRDRDVPSTTRGPRARAAGGRILHAAPALARPAGHPPVLLRLRNQFLWPLCHLRPALTRTRARTGSGTCAVNARFAEAVSTSCEIDGGGAPSGSRTTTWRWRPPCAARSARTSPSRTSGTSPFRRSSSSASRAGTAAAARPAGQRPLGIPPPAVLRQLPALRRVAAAGREGGLGPSAASTGRPHLLRARVSHLHRRRCVPRGRRRAGCDGACRAAARALRARACTLLGPRRRPHRLLEGARGEAEGAGAALLRATRSCGSGSRTCRSRCRAAPASTPTTG